jgi:phage terminase Nu1 subunit (DNA packaging protein)
MEKICGSSVRRVDQIDSSPVVRDRGDQEKYSLDQTIN